VTLAELGQIVAIVVGILVVGTALIRTISWALARKLEEDKRANAVSEAQQEDRVLELTEKERDRYKTMADQVPKLESRLDALREEVGARGAIAALELKVVQVEERTIGRIQAHEDRARRADERQERANKAIVQGINEILFKLHGSPVRVETPGEEGGG
jgi:uncharacterized protein YbjT (DUF2867 family)